MAIEAPLLPLPPSDRLHLLRTSNIIGIATEPFDPDTYQVGITQVHQALSLLTRSSAVTALIHATSTSYIPTLLRPPRQPSQDTYVDEATGATRARTSQNGMIRWRKRRLPDGREVTESNARFVRWSDGSLQVIVN